MGFMFVPFVFSARQFHLKFACRDYPKNDRELLFGWASHQRKQGGIERQPTRTRFLKRTERGLGSSRSLPK